MSKALKLYLLIKPGWSWFVADVICPSIWPIGLASLFTKLVGGGVGAAEVVGVDIRRGTAFNGGDEE